VRGNGGAGSGPRRCAVAREAAGPAVRHPWRDSQRPRPLRRGTLPIIQRTHSACCAPIARVRLGPDGPARRRGALEDAMKVISGAAHYRCHYRPLSPPTITYTDWRRRDGATITPPDLVANMQPASWLPVRSGVRSAASSSPRSVPSHLGAASVCCFITVRTDRLWTARRNGP
jgi:hypothetical protein